MESKNGDGSAILQHIISSIALINIVFLFFFHRLSYGVQDILRASIYMILISSASIWASGNLLDSYKDILSVFSADRLKEGVQVALIACGTILLHVVPFLFVDFPHKPASILFAYAIMLACYLFGRSYVRYIYSSTLNSDTTMKFTGVIGLCMMAYLLAMN